MLATSNRPWEPDFSGRQSPRPMRRPPMSSQPFQLFQVDQLVVAIENERTTPRLEARSRTQHPGTLNHDADGKLGRLAQLFDRSAEFVAVVVELGNGLDYEPFSDLRPLLQLAGRRLDHGSDRSLPGS